MGVFQKTVLSNGVRVVSEYHPHARAISLGLWVTTGTRDEKADEAGVSHLLEHLVFKGTKNRNSYQIAKSLESLGGDLNAYTTKEYTCYHSLVLKDHWPIAMDVLSDLVSNMKVSAKDFRLEKGVILQEIAMSDDNDEDRIHDLLFERIYGKHPLAKPILGTIKSVAQMKASQVNRVYKQRYGSDALIISAAGPVDHFALVDAVQKQLKKKTKAVKPPPRKKARWKPVRNVVEKDGESVNLLWALPSIGFRDEDRFEAYIVNAALGGGMTSRLFQAVREKKGLVYTIHSSLNTFVDSGMITIFAGAELAQVKQVGEVVAKEVRRLKEKGLSRSELEQFKTQLTGSLLLGADDLESRMSSLGVNEMVFGSYRSVDDIVAQIQAIDEKRMKNFLRDHFDPSQMAGIALGPGVKELETWWKDLDFGGRR